MGQVYRGEQVTLGKSFAVKILAPHLMHDEASHARFANEAHNAANLNHPNCVSVVDYGRTSDGVTYIVMEFVEGKTLEDIIVEQHPLGRERIVDLTLQILSALTEAHGLGILHRDLKPENILVQELRTHGELAKVVDFGIAKLMDGAQMELARPGLTRQGMVCGTPEYMSPEQARGQSLDPRSDLYSVGCVLYQMLTQHPPFESASAVEILHRHLHEEPVPPGKLMGTKPDPLEDVCMRALAKNPDERFGSAVAFREALIRATTSQPATPETINCGACGSDMRAMDKFCPTCGAPSPTKSGGVAGVRPKRHPTRRSGLTPVQGDRERTAEVVVRNFPLPLAGREDLFQRARGLLAHPRPGLVTEVLTGPLGIGKTRMVDEIASMAEQLGWNVFYVGADPTGAATPLWPIRRMVSQLLDLDAMDCTTHDLGRAANLGGLAFEELPGLAELFGLEGPAHTIEYQVRKRECFASAVQGLLEGGRGQPALLVFDDIDAYDTSSREILRRLAHKDSEAPIVVLCTTVEEELAWLGGTHHSLAALDAEAVEDVCRQVTIGVNPGSTLPQRVSSGGPITPLRLELRLRLLALGFDDDLRASDDELIEARYNRLTSEARAVLECSAVLGERFPEADLLDLVHQMPGGFAADADEILAQLHVGGILLITGRGERAFAHALLHKVAYRTGDRQRLRQLHELAATCSRLAAASVSVRAIHYTAAGSDEATQALIAAATTAEQRFDDRAATDFLMAAFSSLDLQHSTPERRAAQAVIVEALGRVMREKPKSMTTVDMLREQLQDSHSPPDQARLHQALGRHLSRIGKYEESTEAYKRALGPAIAAGDRARMLDVYRELSQVYVRLGGWKRALDELKEGLDMCTLGEGPRADVDAPMWRYLLGIGSTCRAAGQLTEARNWCGHALFQAERSDNRLGLLRVHAELAWVLRELDQQLLAEQHLARALEEARHFGDRLTTAELLLERARTRAARGKIAEAERCCHEALRLARVIDWRAGIRHAERALEMLTKTGGSSGPRRNLGR